MAHSLVVKAKRISNEADYSLRSNNEGLNGLARVGRIKTNLLKESKGDFTSFTSKEDAQTSFQIDIQGREIQAIGDFWSRSRKCYRMDSYAC